MISSARFRHQVKCLIVKKGWRQLKKWCYPQTNQVAPDNLQSDVPNMEIEEIS